MLPKQSRSAQSASPPLRDLGSALVSGDLLTTAPRLIIRTTRNRSSLRLARS